jgi:snurportin-1
MALPRPEGQRCLVIAQQHKTIARTRSGSIFQTFSSCLPGGSWAQGGSPDAFSVLDAIYSPATGTYYVLDIVAWNSYMLYDCSAEFRCFWMHMKICELSGGQKEGLAFVPVPVFPCTPGEHANIDSWSPFLLQDSVGTSRRRT